MERSHGTASAYLRSASGNLRYQRDNKRPDPLQTWKNHPAAYSYLPFRQETDMFPRSPSPAVHRTQGMFPALRSKNTRHPFLNPPMTPELLVPDHSPPFPAAHTRSESENTRASASFPETALHTAPEIDTEMYPLSDQRSRQGARADRDIPDPDMCCQIHPEDFPILPPHSACPHTRILPLP